MTDASYFTPATFAFLSDLAGNNDRDWFERNRRRYEDHVKQPALRFIMDFGPHLETISPHFRADPRPVGGSFFRIHRDVRFSKDKSPYKTHAGLHFRHVEARDVHAPGYYLHIQPREAFLGVGIWHPDARALGKIRGRIVEDPEAWKAASMARGFRSRFELAGDALTRPPRGFAADHPLIEDLKRKDFVGVARLSEASVTSPGFLEEFSALCRAGATLNRFLCEALGVAH